MTLSPVPTDRGPQNPDPDLASGSSSRPHPNPPIRLHVPIVSSLPSPFNCPHRNMAKSESLMGEVATDWMDTECPEAKRLKVVPPFSDSCPKGPGWRSRWPGESQGKSLLFPALGNSHGTAPSCPSLTRPLLPGQGGVFLEESPWPRQRLCFFFAGFNSVQRVQAENVPRGF